MTVELERSNVFMLAYLIRALLFTTLLFNEVVHVDCCLFKISKPKASAYWDTMKHSRRLHKPACECGIYDINATSTSWNVYVHTTHPVSKNVITCTGTVINSNMVVTSHKCLLLGGNGDDSNNVSRMSIVDLLKFKHGVPSIARAEHVLVTRTSKIETATTVGDNFTVVDIWYNPNFAISSETGRFPENDMALIKVSENFIDQKYAPICLPYYDKKLEEDGGFDLEVEGYFYVYRFVKKRSLGAVVVHSSFTNGYTLEKSTCYDKLENRMKQMGSFDDEEANVFYKTICFDFVFDSTPEKQGGPLVVTSDVSENKAFLLGISTDFDNANSQTDSAGSAGHEVAFFSSIFPLIKYIEYFSQNGNGKSLQESTWCRIPKFELKNEEQKPRALQRNNNWPWDHLSELDLVRDESLDCLCGKPNTHMRGRIAGGEEAIPREFGWMALVQMYPSGKGKKSDQCGGSIINDRIILTAAHCVVVDKWIQNDNEKVAVDPENIVVTLNAHLRKGDPIGVDQEVSAVLFHPGYFFARKEKYFDFDIALLVLKKPLQFERNAPGFRPVCLFKMGKYQEVVGKFATVVGWGLTKPKDRNSAADTLQKIRIPIKERSYCSDVARSKVTENFLCAGTLDMHHDAARGDSGGPLQIEDKNNSQWYQVGSVSWGEDVLKKGEVLTAAFYVDLQKMMPFINYHSNRLGAKWCDTSTGGD